MKKLYYDIVCSIAASVLFTDCFLCGLLYGIKDWITVALLRVYSNLKHPLNKLKSCFLLSVQ